jgi:hypothetical protein
MSPVTLIGDSPYFSFYFGTLCVVSISFVFFNISPQVKNMYGDTNCTPVIKKWLEDKLVVKIIAVFGNTDQDFST